MIAIENGPEHVLSGYQTELRVERTDISFHDLAGDKVRIEITVHNDGEHSSAPTPMRLESAPLGAFVPWRPLGRLLVPPLEPGESRQLSIEVGRPRPTPLGGFSRVPPNRLLTAANAPDQQEPVRQSGGLGIMRNLFRRDSSVRPAQKNPGGRTSLASDFCDLLGRGQPYWAGNINVFVGRRSVERHMARALRVYAGRTNFAMFAVGNPGMRDAYAFELVGLAPDWKATVYNMRDKQSFLLDASDFPIETKQWVETEGGLMAMLAVQPPRDCQEGNLEVHVTKRSSGKTAIVEFNLDPAAQGTGCYVI